MKKDLLIVGLAAVFIISMSGAAGYRPAGGSQSFAVQQTEAFAYVCLPQKGSFEKIGEAIGSLMQEMQAQNVVPAGPMVGLYFNSPDQVKPEDLQWEIGFPVTAQALIQPPLQKKEWNYTQVVAGLHQGPYEKTGETIQMTSPDQVLRSGVLESGAVASVHIKGGTANGTGLLFEIHPPRATWLSRRPTLAGD